MVLNLEWNSEVILNYDEVVTNLTKKVQSSELSRNPTHVFAAAEKGPILVTRRDGNNLVLMTEGAHLAQQEVAPLVSAVVTASLGIGRDFSSRLADQLPWMLALSPAARVDCSEELTGGIRAFLATGESNLAISIFESWKETATALAAGLRGDVDWLDAPELAHKPV